MMYVENNGYSHICPGNECFQKFFNKEIDILWCTQRYKILSIFKSKYNVSGHMAKY